MTANTVSTKMSSAMVKKINEMGFERYIAEVHSRYQFIGGLKVLGYALFFSVALIAASFIFTYSEGGEVPSWLPMVLRITGIVFAVGGVVAYFAYFSPFKIKEGLTTYKEKLTKRHGDYKSILKEVESQLDSTVYRTQCSTYITKDWVIILDTRRPVSFTHKTEIAALIGTTSGTVLVWDDGEFVPDMSFGNSTWWKVFGLISTHNPYILTNRDSFENNQGQVVSIGTTTTHFAKRSAENGKYVALQYVKNKKAEVLPVWHKKN